MTLPETKRSGMLSTIYNMLPGIDDDYAAKLVYTLEDKKTLPQLQQDIADLAAQLNSDSAATDTLIAKMLLDECTLSAALRQLRVYNNSTSITELSAALALPAPQTSRLLEVYASFSSHLYFDEEFEKALGQVNTPSLTDEQKARQAVELLLKKAQTICKQAQTITAQNRTDILKLADKYHLSVKLTAELELLYSQPASISFKPAFEQLLAPLLLEHDNPRLCASLAARVLLGQLTPKDAQEVALTSKLLCDEILEEDLLVIACRYLKVKTPQDITNAFDGVLKRLPYADNPEENLGLAVRVLLDGTPESFDKASRRAALKRDRELLRRNLAKLPLYAGYEYELAKRFGGQKTLPQLEHQMQEILETLPYCVTPADNKELACKVLLGLMSVEEAKQQATYMRDLKAKTVTQGLTPGLMKHYLGTQSADELVQFFEETLRPYTFWKSNREKHIFALRTLVEERNGTYDQRVSLFVLDMLEQGSSMEILTDLLETLRRKKWTGDELEHLLEQHKIAMVASK